MQRTGVYPAATPPRDCPSPTDNDDIFARDFSQIWEKIVKQIEFKI